jgi:hypothetical protein
MSDDEEAKLLNDLLPLSQHHSTDDENTDDHKTDKNKEVEEDDKMSRRRGLTITATLTATNEDRKNSGVHLVDGNSINMFKPVKPPKRTLLGPLNNIDDDDDEDDSDDDNLDDMANRRVTRSIDSIRENDVDEPTSTSAQTAKSSSQSKPSNNHHERRRHRNSNRSSMSFNEKQAELAPKGHFEKSRLFLSNFMEVAAPDLDRMDMLTPSDELEMKIDAIDVLRERESHVIWLLYARNTKPNPQNSSWANSDMEATGIRMSGDRESCSNKANKAPPFAQTPLPPIEIVGMNDTLGEDSLVQGSLPHDWHHFVSGISNITDHHNNYENDEENENYEMKQENKKNAKKKKLNTPKLDARCRGLGVALNPSTHEGFDGGIDMKRAAKDHQPIVYYADSADEVVFYDTTRPLYLKTRGQTESGTGSAPLKNINSLKTTSSGRGTNDNEDDENDNSSMPIMSAFLGINSFQDYGPPVAVQPFPAHDHPAVQATVFELDYPSGPYDDNGDDLGGGKDSEDDLGNANPRSSFLQKNPLSRGTIVSSPMSTANNYHRTTSTNIPPAPALSVDNRSNSRAFSTSKSVDKNHHDSDPSSGVGDKTKTKHQYRRTSALETSIVTPGLAQPRAAVFIDSFREEEEEDLYRESAEPTVNNDDDEDEAATNGSRPGGDGKKKLMHFVGGGGEHGRVVVLWNECVQQFGPNSEQWTMYGLGGLTGPAMSAGIKAANRSKNQATQAHTMEMAMSSSLGSALSGNASGGGEGGTSSAASAAAYKAEALYHTAAAVQASQVAASSGIALYIIIDQLSGGLYRTRLYSGDGSAFAPGTLGPHGTNHSLIGPLSHGMVVPSSLLGPLVRQTALNGCKRLLGLKRRRHELTKNTNGVASSGSDFDRWCCPYDSRLKAISVLKRHIQTQQNNKLGELLKATIAPPDPNGDEF